MSLYLRVGDSTIPVALRVLGSDLIPDATLVNAARFRLLRNGSAPGAVGTAITAGISQAITGSYVASFTPTSIDAALSTATADTLRIYVDSSLDGGTTWIPSLDPFLLAVKEN